MARRDYVLVLVGAPAATVATLWALLALDHRNSVGLFVFRLASIPALAGIVWGVTRRPSFWRALALFAAVASISAVFVIVSFYVVILIAATQCPDDAYECPL